MNKKEALSHPLLNDSDATQLFGRGCWTHSFIARDNASLSLDRKLSTTKFPRNCRCPSHASLHYGSGGIHSKSGRHAPGQTSAVHAAIECSNKSEFTKVSDGVGWEEVQDSAKFSRWCEEMLTSTCKRTCPERKRLVMPNRQYRWPPCEAWELQRASCQVRGK